MKAVISGEEMTELEYNMLDLTELADNLNTVAAHIKPKVAMAEYDKLVAAVDAVLRIRDRER